MAVVGMSPTRDRYPTVAPQLLASDDEGESLVSTWMISSEIPPPRPNVKQNLIGHAFSWWMVFTVVVCVCWGASYAWMWTLPSAKPVTATTDQFSEGRAMRYLDDLAACGNVRYVGTSELAEAYQYILNTIIEINATKANTDLLIELDFRNNTKGGDSTFTELIWQNYPLISVRLRYLDSEISSLLIDGHVDGALEEYWCCFTSFLQSRPGVSDDLYSIGLMLEMIRTLANSPAIHLQSSLIFVMTMEEEGLMGAWNFMRDNPWNTYSWTIVTSKACSTVAAMLGIDAAGAASHLSIAYQVLASYQKLTKWSQAQYYSVSRAYSGVPHPFAFAIMDDLGRKGIFGGGSDYSIYESFGIRGLELMHILNAEVYHTPLDVLSHVKTGVLQGDGDNTLYMYSNRVVFYRDEHAIILCGPGMLLIMATNTAWAVGLSLFSVIGVGIIVAIVFAILKLDRGKEYIKKYTVVTLVSFLFAAAALVLAIILAIICGVGASLISKYSFNNNYALVSAMAVFSSIVGLLLVELSYDYLFWRLRKKYRTLADFNGSDLQWGNLAGTSVLYAILFIAFLAADWRFGSIFVYPAVAGPVAILMHALTKALFKLDMKAFLSQALGPVLAIGDVSGSIFICAAVSFFFTASVQQLFAYTHGGTRVVTPNWFFLLSLLIYIFQASMARVQEPCALSLLLLTHFMKKFYADRDQGSRFLGIYWLLGLLVAISLAFLIAVVSLPAFTSATPLRYIANYVFDTSTNESYVSVVPNALRGDISNFLQTRGFNTSYCDSFWSDDSGICVPFSSFSTYPQERVTLTRNELSFNMHQVEIRLLDTRYSRFRVTLNCNSEAATNISVNGIPSIYQLEQINYSGGDTTVTNHTVSFSSSYLGECSITVYAQAREYYTQLQEVIDSMPAWTTTWGRYAAMLPCVTVLHLHVPAVA